jgi:TonB-dependent receptor
MKTMMTTLALACSVSFIATSAYAAEDATLIGQLANSEQNRVFSGATVTLKSSGKTTYSRRDGTFRFSDLEAGTYTLVIEYLGEPTIEKEVTLTSGINLIPAFSIQSAEEELEEVMVLGQRSGQASALNHQRTASNIKSVVSADAIGQFPDQNAAESLQRLPGISIERDQGEGRFVGIRGIDPNLNSVTINGLNIPSPEAGVRSVALDVIPSELIQTLEVSKSVTSDMDADAIGGAIAVKSVSAFDRTGDTASINAQIGHNELRDELNPKAAITFTKLWDNTFGIAGAVSYLKRDFGSDNIESNGDDEIEQRHYTITRERLGSALNLDYRPDFNNQYYIRTLYSEFSDDEYRQRNTFVLDGEDSEVERESKDRYEEQSIFTLSAGAEHQRGDWLLDYQLGYAKSDEDEPNSLYYTFVTENSSIEGDLEKRIPTVTYDESVNDLSLYEVDEISLEKGYAKDIESSIQANLTRAFSYGPLTEIKTGFKYRSREKSVDNNISIYDGDFDDIDPSQFATSDLDYGLGDFGPGLNRSAMRQYFNENSDSFELAELDSELESNGSSYQTNEDIFAAYAMASFQLDKLDIVAGVRYENTDFSTSGMRVELVENEETDVEEVTNTPWEGDRNYDYFLPSINATYTFSDKLILRAAFTQTISRPRFEESAAYQIIESKTEEDDDGEFVTEREAEVGNPDLLPYESNNFDLSLEYYPGDIGVLSAGLFYKKIDNFVIYADVAGTDDWEGYEEVIQPLNGDTADLTGIELSWVKAFDNGLLLSANGTFSDSEATTLLDGEEYRTSLPNQSDTITNLAIGYENQNWSLRLTMAYKSENLEEIDGDLIRMEDAHQQFDFTGKYFINDDLNVYFNAINITDEAFYNYFDSKNINAQYEEYGRTLEIGFRWQL